MVAKNNSNEIAVRYAGAFFDLMTEKKQFETLEKDVLKLDEAMSKSDELREFVKDDFMPIEAKNKVFDKLIKKFELADLTANFIKMIIAKQRVSELPEVISLLKASISARKGEVRAELIVAGDIDQKAIDKLARALAKKMVIDKVEFNVVRDKAIIGGAILKYGSMMIDASVKSKIDRLRYRLQKGDFAQDNSTEVA